MPDTMARRLGALRATGLTVVQAAVAAGLAWLLARELLGHAQPFFAPVAAILTLGLSYGQRARRAVEVAVGVALGIFVGDLLVLAIGTGPWQLGLVVALAMAAAIVLGGGPLLVSQAAVSAVLVATLQPPTAHGISGARFLDALLGGIVALVVNAAVPTDPLRLVRRAAEPVIGELAAALDDVAAALERRDLEAARAALRRARSIDPATAQLREALSAGRDQATLAPPRRRARGQLAVIAAATAQIDHAIRNTRVLARGAIRAVELDERVPPGAIASIRDLAAAVRGLGEALAGREPSLDAEDAALRAAARSTAALEETSNLSASVIVGQVRSTATDLLRGLGMDGDEARAAVRDAAARLRM
ncbi:MAG TPA: FUSC family protein [Capillimicrobium sp.]|nr:FUSC family protein [Capillimicrobium sp.]